MKTSKYQRGFTLIETVIYLFILAVLSVVVVSLLVGMMRNFYRLQSNRRLAHSAETVLGRLEREIRQAESVDSINSILSANPGKLILNKTVSGSATTIEFSLNGSTLRIKEGGGAYATTTDGHISVSNLIFRSVGTSGSDAVRVEMQLTDDGLYGSSANFYQTVVLRGSY